MANDIAKIIIFTYRRVPHKLIDSLLKNKLSKYSDLIIYSDGAKKDLEKNDILEVREYLKTITGFKSIKIIESSKNKGLANSIIDGVSEVIDKYEKVIVLEDDLIVSEDFLEYMNHALSFYKDDEKIWSISGYGPKLPCLKNYEEDLYLSVRASSWGWATWKDRWRKVDWSVKDFNNLKNDIKLKKEFNLGGNDMYKMLELQILGKIDSWAIRWCYSQFKLNMYTVYPKKSKIINDGFEDNKGTHNSGVNEKYQVKISNQSVVFKKLDIDFDIIECFQDFHNLSLKTKIGYFLKKYGGYKFIKKLQN
jgi:hypothetical protein